MKPLSSLEYFKKGSAHLEKLGITSELYACPLCLVAFDKSAFLQKHLTREHAPPKRLGGKVALLTCRQCNSEAGHAIDAHAHGLVELKRRSSGLLGTEAAKLGTMFIHLDDYTFPVEVAKEDGGLISIKTIKGHSPPGAEESFIESIQSAGAEFNLSFKERANIEKAKRSYLRAAFLIAVGTFGYTYAAAPNLQKIRQSFSGEGREPGHVLFTENAMSNIMLYKKSNDIIIFVFRHAIAALPHPRIAPDQFTRLMKQGFDVNSDEFERSPFDYSFPAIWDQTPIVKLEIEPLK